MTRVIGRARWSVTATLLTLCLTSPGWGLQQSGQDSLQQDSVTIQSTRTDAHGARLRGGVLALFSRRNAKWAGRIGAGSGVHPGVEVSVWIPRVWGTEPDETAESVLGITSIGLYGRLLGGGFSADSTAELPGNEALGEINNADVELYVGRPVLHARAGYGIRSFTGALGTSRWSFLRLGARSSFSLGTGGEFEVTLGVAFYVGVGGDSGGSGREGETRLTFVPQCGAGTSLTSWVCRRITGIAAYRFEQFTVHAPATIGGDRPEEVSTVIVGIGIRPDD